LCRLKGKIIIKIICRWLLHWGGLLLLLCLLCLLHWGGLLLLLWWISTLPAI
jgi:hypothetical protein